MRRVTGTLLLLAPLVAGCRSQESGRDFAVQEPGVGVALVRNGSVDRFLPPRGTPPLEVSQPAPGHAESDGRTPTAAILDVVGQPQDSAATLSIRPNRLPALPAPEIIDTDASDRLTLHPSPAAITILPDVKPVDHPPVPHAPAPGAELSEAKHPLHLPEPGAQPGTTRPPPEKAADTPSLPKSPPELVRNPEPARIVRSKAINLDYAVKDLGAAEVEVWHTRDGKDWKKLAATAPSPSRRVARVEEEGRHGFTLVARNGAGLATEPPKSGDEPQVWVEVDETKPEVQLVKLVPVAGAATPTIAVHWTATDKNFGPRPIRLSYAEQVQGPWKPIADAVDNSGRYEWKVPAPAPARVMVRVEATDRAGNVGADQMPEPVALDKSLPAVSVTDVSPAEATESSSGPSAPGLE